MKAQIKFQKILTLITLIIAALTFVFAICFFSGNLADLFRYKRINLQKTTANKYDGADDFLYFAQDFISILVVLAIIFICICAFLYLTDTHKRRKYYVTNYVAIGLVIAITLVTAVFCVIYLSLALAEFQAIDWASWKKDAYDKVAALGYPSVSQETTMFVIGYVTSGIVLATGVVWVLNLVWKVKLMKGEKAHLEAGLVREVA